MTHPKLILKRIQFPTIHIHTPRLIYTPTRSYEFGHYRSFWKVKKTPVLSKLLTWAWNIKNEMRPKWLIRGHQKISKKSKNTSLGSKLRELCIGQVDLFCKIAKSQICSNLHLLLNGPKFLCLRLITNIVHDLWDPTCLIYSFIQFNLIFIHLKFK